MTDLILYSKPFDWNDNLSKEALEDFEGIQKDLSYCTCQSIGMALAKLELLEKQMQEPKSEWEHDHEILMAYSDGANAVLDMIRAEISKQSRMHMDGDLYIKTSKCMQIIGEYKAEGSGEE